MVRPFVQSCVLLVDDADRATLQHGFFGNPRYLPSLACPGPRRLSGRLALGHRLASEKAKENETEEIGKRESLLSEDRILILNFGTGEQRLANASLSTNQNAIEGSST
jgi:hypothetical protein